MKILKKENHYKSLNFTKKTCKAENMWKSERFTSLAPLCGWVWRAFVLLRQAYHSTRKGIVLGSDTVHGYLEEVPNLLSFGWIFGLSREENLESYVNRLQRVTNLIQEIIAHRVELRVWWVWFKRGDHNNLRLQCKAVLRQLSPPLIQMRLQITNTLPKKIKYQ